MESTTTDQQFAAPEAPLSQPHFDEEATVLSARPVVPLTTIKEVKAVDAKTSFPHPWMLGLALIGTLLIGIFATAIYYSRVNKNDSQLLDDSEAAVFGETGTTTTEGFSGPVGAKPAVNADSPLGVRKETPPKAQPVKASAEDSKKPIPRLVTVIREKGNRSEAAEESRQDLKAARKEARQERRRAERERRGARSSDGVLRIRDIFEGAPRP